MIKDTINKDHEEANVEVRKMQKDLRAERLRLIKELMAQQGIVIDLEDDEGELFVLILPNFCLLSSSESDRYFVLYIAN